MKEQIMLNGDIKKIPPLPRRVIPFLWEDLASVLARASRRMGYQEPHWILRPECSHYHIHPHKIPFLHRAADYQLLEQLLQLDEEALYLLTLNRFAPSLGGMGSQHPQDIRHPLLPINVLFPKNEAMKVCPVCLDTPEGYDRLYWRIAATILCPEHGVALISRCPHCFAPISGLRPLLTKCPSCQIGDYRSRSPTLPLQKTLLYASEMQFLRRIGVVLPQTEKDAFSETPLLRLPSWQYFRLFEHFQTFVNYPSSYEAILSSLYRVLSERDPVTPFQAYSGQRKLPIAEIVALFHYLFAVAWPTHFSGLLEGIQQGIAASYYDHWERQEWDQTVKQKQFWQSIQQQSNIYSTLSDFFLTYKSSGFPYFPPSRRPLALRARRFVQVAMVGGAVDYKERFHWYLPQAQEWGLPMEEEKQSESL